MTPLPLSPPAPAPAPAPAPLRALALALALASSQAARADPTPPDHGKVATEEATPVGHGAVELELAYTPSLVHEGGVAGFDEAAHGHAHGLSLGVFYGVTEHLDVKVAAGVAALEDRSDPVGPTTGTGATDLVLGSRWRFLADARWALDLTLATTLVAAIGEDGDGGSLGLTQGFWSLRNALVASRDWRRLTANAELAMTVPLGGPAPAFDVAAAANLAFGYAFPRFQPIAELNYEVVRGAHLQHRLAATAGLSLTSARGTRLLAGVQRGIWGRNVRQTTAGLVAFKVAF